MEARAYLKYARISPRKVSVVLDLIRNKPVDYAMAGRFPVIRGRVPCVPGPDPQAHSSQSAGSRIPHRQEDLARHPRAQGTRITQ